MQVKKFEAPTIQEALESVKRELGPEAIILQTKKNKRGFGLSSKASVEVTAAVSDRSFQKKQRVETKLPESTKVAMRNLPAGKQADVFDKYTHKHLERAAQTKDRVEMTQKSKPITATRYIDIADEKTHLTKSKSLPQSQPIVIPKDTQSGQLEASLKMSTKTKISLEDEIDYLKKMIDELKTVQMVQKQSAENNQNQKSDMILQNNAFEIPALQDAFEQLVVNGVERRYVLSLIKKVAFELGPDRSRSAEYVMDLLAQEIMETVKVFNPLTVVHPRTSQGAIKDSGRALGEPVLIALIGPTGVGKTTTIAKLATEAIHKNNLKVGLINLDGFKMGAFDQLGTYAKVLNLPFRSTSSADDLKAALSDFKNLDLILIDTTGRSQRDPASLAEIEEILKSVQNLQTYLVLSAITRDAELFDAAHRFAVLEPKGMIISKLDEAMLYGSIYNLSQKIKLPFLYFTTGQTVPGDIEEATPERLVTLILDI